MRRLRILAVDGGTSSTRVWALEDGRVLDWERRHVGARDLARDRDRDWLAAQLSDMAEKVVRRVGWNVYEAMVAFGMITSELGLEEIPHLKAPAGPVELAEGLQRRTGVGAIPVPVYLVPGVLWDGEAAATADFMRGEETEVAGLLALDSRRPPLLYVSPGSHTKFIVLDKSGRITASLTTLSGELLWALSQETILAGLVDAGREDSDEEAVRAGAAVTAEQGLTRALYVTRLLNRLERAERARCTDFVRGALAASDLQALEVLHRDRLLPPQVWVAGEGGLALVYRQLLGCQPWVERVECLAEPLGAHGAWHLYQRTVQPGRTPRRGAKIS